MDPLLIIVGIGAVAVWFAKRNASPKVLASTGNDVVHDLPGGTSSIFSPQPGDTSGLRFFGPRPGGVLPGPAPSENPNPALAITPEQITPLPVLRFFAPRERLPISGGDRRLALESGGGGPENRGAIAVTGGGDRIEAVSRMNSADDDWLGPARPSTTPITAGGGLGQPADAFRWLGDNFGARQ